MQVPPPILKIQRSLWDRLYPCITRFYPPITHAQAKDDLRAVYRRTCHVFTNGSGVVHGWSRSRTDIERYRMGIGTRRPTPAQHCHHTAHLYQNSQFGARIAQQTILRLPAGSSQAHLYNQTPQLCHSLQQF